MVAVGNLDKVWLEVPEDVAESELQEAFRKTFGAEWDEVLAVADKSFSYNAANSAYFAVRGLRPIENLTLEQLLEQKGVDRSSNIIAS